MAEEQTWDSGGTAHYLPAERARASFDSEALTHLLNGGAAKTKRRRFILMPGKAYEKSFADKHHWGRQRLIAEHFRSFISIHKDFVEEGFQPTREEVIWMSESAMNTGSLMPHFGLFLPTILGQATLEQQMWWLPRALTFGMVGAYAQTELGHGSNVRGLQTVATYDAATQEFVLDTPTLQSMKWWNSNLGVAATHAAVYAQLVTQGVERGVHVFMLQVRDEHHRLLPGIECGDVGPKLGDAAIDTGFMRLRGARVPREHMMAKRQRVLADGTYVRGDGDSGGASAAAARPTDPAAIAKAEAKAAAKTRMAYLTMMQMRAGMIKIAGGKLASAATIGVRYSCVRHQGFADGGAGISYRSAERPILDYQYQQLRLTKQVAAAYAIKFTSKWILDRFDSINAVLGGAGSVSVADADGGGGGGGGGGLDMEAALAQLPEIHASSAGLKGLCTQLAADGIEDCRKCCGGHGYLLSSGVAALAADYVWQTTAEGDFVVMLLQTARYLMKALEGARRGKPMAGELAAALGACADPSFDPLVDARPEEPAPSSSSSAFFDLGYLVALFRWRALVATVNAGAALERRRAAVEAQRAAGRGGGGRSGAPPSPQLPSPPPPPPSPSPQQAGSAEDVAWAGSAALLVRAARCHCAYFMLEKFAAGVRAAEAAASAGSGSGGSGPGGGAVEGVSAAAAAPCAAVLARLAALHACLDISTGQEGWGGLLSAAQVGAADDSVTALLEALRPDSVALVDAFDIPDRVLGSTLGRSDGNVYEALFEQAHKSELNVHLRPGGEDAVFEGFAEHLAPHLDGEFLALRNGLLPEAQEAREEEEAERAEAEAAKQAGQARL